MMLIQMSIHKLKVILCLNRLKFKIKVHQPALIQHFATMFLQINYHLHSNIRSKIINNIIDLLSLRIIIKMKIVLGQWMITHTILKMNNTLHTIIRCHLIKTLDILLILYKWILLTIKVDLVSSHHNFYIQSMEITMANVIIVINSIISLDLANTNLTINIKQIIVIIHTIIIITIINHLLEQLYKRQIANRNQKLIKIPIHKNQNKILSCNRMALNQMVW